MYQSQQWHLTSANIVDAWTITRGSSDIKVCILDDGVDVGHSEFASKVAAEFDFFNNTSDARPKGAQDNHGTACAGVATAAGVKALGAAPDCSLIAACTPAWGASSDEAKMFKWAADQGADVISCSWGPPDGTGSVDPLPDLTRAAIHYCVTEGRDGKGCSVLFAAGNGNESVSNDGYASNPDVMAIAACTDADTRAGYSDFGPEVSICAPSNGGTNSILTTDRRGADGYNKTHPGQDDPAKPWMNDPFADLDYTSMFGGTSSSTPLVAGVVGLMLSANPDLTPTQIRNCLQNTAKKIGPSSSYDSNGHSPQFGYGKIDAGAAVREAQSLSDSPSTALPTITATDQSVSRSGPPPSFDVDPSPNTHYHVEVAAQTQWLDDESGQPADGYYATWEDGGFQSASTFTLPQAAWDRVKNNTQLFYRAWTSSSATDWVDTLATTGDAGGAAAESIEVAGQETPSDADRPTISGPTSIARSDAPPTFTVNPRPNTHYAFEVAATADLLDQESGQSLDESYASWEDGGFLSDSSYQLSDAAWERIRGNDRLFYRAWTTSSATESTDTLATAETGAEADSFEVTGGASSEFETVTFPSGVTLKVADSDSPGSVGSSNPQGSGVPLLSVAGRGNERLSTSFLVKELAGPNAAFARIDVALVEALQAIRDQVGASVKVLSAYQPSPSRMLGKRDRRQRSRLRSDSPNPGDRSNGSRFGGARPGDAGCQIGIGLGSNSIEIDVRGSLATWVPPGAAMTIEQLDKFVGEDVPSNRMMGTRARGGARAGGRSDRDDASMGRTAVEVPEITDRKLPTPRARRPSSASCLGATATTRWRSP